MGQQWVRPQETIQTGNRLAPAPPHPPPCGADLKILISMMKCWKYHCVDCNCMTPRIQEILSEFPKFSKWMSQPPNPMYPTEQLLHGDLASWIRPPYPIPSPLQNLDQLLSCPSVQLSMSIKTYLAGTVLFKVLTCLFAWLQSGPATNLLRSRCNLARLYFFNHCELWRVTNNLKKKK